MKNLIVLDSSVFNKLYLNERDRDRAIALFRKAAFGDLKLIAPGLLFYEVVHTAQKHKVPIKKIVHLLKRQTEHNLTLMEPSAEHIEKALEIVEVGHPKSGYPSIYDSIFHAMAIVEDGIFLTADSRHQSKTKHIGNIKLLSEFGE